MQQEPIDNPRPTSRLDANRSIIWRGFDFETGSFLLHIPSSTLVDCHRSMVIEVENTAPDKLSDPTTFFLKELEAYLPKSSEKALPEVDIKSLALNVIQSCNLRCTYCYAGDGDYGRVSKMSFETATAAIDRFARQQSAFHIVFFGGEPLMNVSLIQKIVAYCEAIPTTKFSYGMTTNATLFTPEITEFFKTYNFKLTISYDGKKETASKRVKIDRKTDSRQDVEKNLELFRAQLDALRKCDLRATLCRDDVDELEKTILATLRSQNLRWSYVRHATDVVKDQLTQSEAHKVGKILERVVDSLLENKDYQRLLKLGNIKVHIHDIYKGKTQQRFCGAGLNYASVSSDGDLFVCHRFTEDKNAMIGSVKDGIDLKQLSVIQNLRTTNQEPCQSCWMREWCGGGCMHEHYTSKDKKLDQVDPVFCILQDYECKQAVRVFTHIKKHAPELLA